ncbi:MAG: cytochrome b/b6 domain-containing protein [Paracoccus sp. (in: a-proteobacteria)]|nr:cytochrome b/b6 domain-containing protein [Paracoccus sp. (in: a-proteobacteria)]
MQAKAPETVKLWDPLLRGFHWLLAAAVISAWALAKFGPAQMTLHFYAGYVVIGLLAFRLIWGVLGPRPARFASFIRGPGAVARYASRLFRREPSHFPGHNPMGALSVVAMLVLLAAQVATGLVADPEDFINTGPLASEVSSATSRLALQWHHRIAGWLEILIILHIAVIVFYLVWKRENLITPMITGWKKIVRREP